MSEKNGKNGKNGKKDEQKTAAQFVRQSPCSECGGQVKRKAIAQEFERQGAKVKISGLLAWVCARCGEIYFEPGGADRFAQAVNALFALALAEKQHKGKVVGSVT